MYQEGAPEFVIDQGMYYPTPTNYGYYCTGFESPVELEDHQNFFSADGSDIQYAGAQNETLSYVYYTPGYGYAQPGYNAYNSYIPGAVMGDSPFVGAQQYYTIPPYQNPVSPTAYVPVYIQPDGIPSTSASAAFSRKSALNQADFLRSATYGQSKHYGFQGGVPDSSGSASAQAHQVRVASGSVQPIGNIPGGKLPSDTWEEQNLDPRTSRSKNQLMVKSYTSKAGNSDAEGNIIIFTDQYNKDNFPVDYVNAKFFVIKSYSEDDVHKSIKYNVWSSTPHGNKNLDVAHEDAQKIAAAKHSGCPIFLFFSVNASGQFCGVAEMIGPVDFQKDMDFWQQNKWSGSFPVKWHIIKNVPNSHFRHIILGNNENKPVTNSRDTQEIMFKQGMEMLKVFKNHAMKTSLLDVFMYYENRQRIMHEEKTMQPIKSFESPVIARAFDPANKWNRVELLRNENVRSTRASSPELLRTIVHSSTKHGSTYSGTTNGNTTNGSLEQFVVEAKDHAFTSKMSALSLNPKLSESEFPTDAAVKTDSAEVVNVGSVTVKVNRFTESPGFLTVGTIPLNPKTLQLDQEGVDAKSCT